jgi:hypothetical protein
MSKHTPGPWWLSPARNALGVVLGGPARPMHHGGTTVGQIASACSQEWMEPGELEANAALIAAAPDLLEALKAFTDAQESKRDAIGNAAIAAAIGDLVLAEEKARSAIAKAEGGAA